MEKTTKHSQIADANAKTNDDLHPFRSPEKVSDKEPPTRECSLEASGERSTEQFVGSGSIDEATESARSNSPGGCVFFSMPETDNEVCTRILPVEEARDSEGTELSRIICTCCVIYSPDKTITAIKQSQVFQAERQDIYEHGNIQLKLMI
jgi:hypothetical protein